MNIDVVAKRLIEFEGKTSYMYRCTGGEVTIGVGHAIPSAEAAAGLLWSASAETAAHDWQTIHSCQSGHVAEYYEEWTTARMNGDGIDRLLQMDIALFAARLERSVPSLYTFPEPAQEALFDMAFNLGVVGLMRFQNMLAACHAGDWEKAATESHRRGIGDHRNEVIADLFRSCR